MSGRVRESLEGERRSPSGDEDGGSERRRLSSSERGGLDGSVLMNATTKRSRGEKEVSFATEGEHEIELLENEEGEGKQRRIREGSRGRGMAERVIEKLN